MSITTKLAESVSPRGLPSYALQKDPKRLNDRTMEDRPRFRGVSKIQHYEFLSKLGEGTFGEVHKARSLRTGGICALKKILMHNERDGFPITALREIKLLKKLSHPNILKLEEMAMEKPKEGKKKATMYMVTPYMDHDLSGLLENPAVRFTEPQIKCYMMQLLHGLQYLHANQILHRDMKAANLLISNEGILQIADFGLARNYDDAPPQRGKGGGEATRDYTSLVVTRWYRPPELLLQLRRYTTAIDMWGVGCVFGEMFKGRPILAGNSDAHQMQMIFELVGTPTEETMPGWTTLPGYEDASIYSLRSPSLSRVFREHGSSAISLLTELLKLDWRKRINAMDALEHPYFHSAPFPAKPHELPRFEDSHELDRRKFRGQRAVLPPAPAGGAVGLATNGGYENSSGSSNDFYHSRARGGNGGVVHGGPHPTRRPTDDHRHYQPPPGHPPPPPPGGPPSGHRPAWAQNAGLPPRPPPPTDGAWQHRDRPNEMPSRGRPPPAKGSGAVGVGGDSYVPSYANRDERLRDRDEDFRRRDPRDERGHYGERRDPPRRRSRSPDYHHRDKDRDRDRDRDRDGYWR